MAIKWLSALSNRGVCARTAILVAVVLVLYAMVAPVAGYLGGTSAVWAATAAAGLCLAGAASSLLVCYVFYRYAHFVAGMLAGMALRFGVPLTGGVVLQIIGGPLAEGGVLYYLFIFYPITLATETALSLPDVHQDWAHQDKLDGANLQGASADAVC